MLATPVQACRKKQERLSERSLQWVIDASEAVLWRLLRISHPEPISGDSRREGGSLMGRLLSRQRFQLFSQ